jgi:hypothetical protein
MTSTGLPRGIVGAAGVEGALDLPPPTVVPASSSNGRPATVSAPFRVMTANVQSFPDRAITAEQALTDLTRNASDADLVLMQEIVTRYRPLVQSAFPSSAWEVYYGKQDNTQPIAFRKSLFAKVAAEVLPLHPARAHLHHRRYTTHLTLRLRELGCPFDVTNLHMVAGAFNRTVEPREALRVEEWNEGIARHLALVEALVRSGRPVIGGGDYNRQLRRHKSLGTEVAGQPVRYAVDPGSIDLLWFIDGKDVTWKMRSKKVYPGRESKSPERNSDHAARVATMTLAAPTGAPKGAARGAARGAAKKAAKGAGGPPRQRAAAPARTHVLTEQKWPPPFELTVFGDGTPKRVDWKTRAALEEAERRLGYPLTIVQGSYNAGGVSASAGTHDRGGVVDLLAWDSKRKVRVLRSVGFAAWYRPTVRGLWGEHIHAVLIDHGALADSAARQVASYRAGRDGLRSNRVDRTWRPSPVPVFEYPPTTFAPVQGEKAKAAVLPVDEPSGRAFPPKRTLDGVDTSHHQSGRIDLRAARAAGVRWWYVKATEGTGFVDDTYDARVRQARKAGMPVGAYHFARPEGGDAVAEARFFLDHTDIRPGDMLPMLDLESDEGLSPRELTAWTGSWVRTVTRDLHRRGMVGRPVIYTPFNLGNGFGCLLWVARYSNDFRPPTIPRPWQRAVIWQHSDGRYGPAKHVPGFGAVDANALHPDVPLSALRLRSRAPRPKPNPAKKKQRPRPAPPPVPAEVPPTEVLAPDLTGATREMLEAAAASIQAALDTLPER